MVKAGRYCSVLMACSGLFWQLPLQALEGSFLGVLADKQPSLALYVATARTPNVRKELTPSQVEQLQALARKITVKVFSGQNSGSGILIRKQGQTYTVLTNRHVLTPADSHRVQTPDGRIYPASVLSRENFGDRDLALIQFRSSARSYTVASLSSAPSPSIGEEVFAAGFPVETEATAFTFTRGQISLIPESPLTEGYQIGYTNDVRKGMSGGPLLNVRGEVIGINGRHAYPLWGNSYNFEDGSQPPEPLQQQMIRLSWAVPVQTFVRLAGTPNPPTLPDSAASPLEKPDKLEPEQPSNLPFLTE